jgi:hypothetical protein
VANLTFAPGKQYKIVSALNANKVITAVQQNGFKLVISDYTPNNPGQKFTFVSDTTGVYSIVCTGNGGTIEIPQNNLNNQGVQLIVGEPNNTVN